MDYTGIIIQKISESERLAQLAEESSELAQAALKLRRTMRKDNPAAITRREAKNNLLEEIADVLNCIDIMKLSAKEAEFINDVRKRKLERWVDRLNGK